MSVTETFHLTPCDDWRAQADSETYAPEPFVSDGFIHCSDGEENVITVGNRYYRDDLRPFVCLVIDVDRVQAPVRYEDPDRIYPHIYGRLNTNAVVHIRDVLREPDGAFRALGS